MTEEFLNGNLAHIFKDKESISFKYNNSKVIMDVKQWIKFILMII